MMNNWPSTIPGDLIVVDIDEPGTRLYGHLIKDARGTHAVPTNTVTYMRPTCPGIVVSVTFGRVFGYIIFPEEIGWIRVGDAQVIDELNSAWHHQKGV